MGLLGRRVVVVSQRDLGMFDLRELIPMRSFYTLSQMYRYIPTIARDSHRPLLKIHIFISTVAMPVSIVTRLRRQKSIPSLCDGLI
jgi:hypothetical protein